MPPDIPADSGSSKKKESGLLNFFGRLKQAVRPNYSKQTAFVEGYRNADGTWGTRQFLEDLSLYAEAGMTEEAVVEFLRYFACMEGHDEVNTEIGRLGIVSYEEQYYEEDQRTITNLRNMLLGLLDYSTEILEQKKLHERPDFPKILKRHWRVIPEGTPAREQVDTYIALTLVDLRKEHPDLETDELVRKFYEEIFGEFLEKLSDEEKTEFALAGLDFAKEELPKGIGEQVNHKIDEYLRLNIRKRSKPKEVAIGMAPPNQLQPDASTRRQGQEMSIDIADLEELQQRFGSLGEFIATQLSVLIVARIKTAGLERKDIMEEGILKADISFTHDILVQFIAFFQGTHAARIYRDSLEKEEEEGEPSIDVYGESTRRRVRDSMRTPHYQGSLAEAIGEQLSPIINQYAAKVIADARGPKARAAEYTITPDSYRYTAQKLEDIPTELDVFFHSFLSSLLKEATGVPDWLKRNIRSWIIDEVEPHDALKKLLPREKMQEIAIRSGLGNATTAREVVAAFEAVPGLLEEVLADVTLSEETLFAGKEAKKQQLKTEIINQKEQEGLDPPHEIASTIRASIAELSEDSGLLYVEIENFVENAIPFDTFRSYFPVFVDTADIRAMYGRLRQLLHTEISDFLQSTVLQNIETDLAELETRSMQDIASLEQIIHNIDTKVNQLLADFSAQFEDICREMIVETLKTSFQQEAEEYRAKAVVPSPALQFATFESSELSIPYNSIDISSLLHVADFAGEFLPSEGETIGQDFEISAIEVYGDWRTETENHLKQLVANIVDSWIQDKSPEFTNVSDFMDFDPKAFFDSLNAEIPSLLERLESIDVAAYSTDLAGKIEAIWQATGKEMPAGLRERLPVLKSQATRKLNEVFQRFLQDEVVEKMSLFLEESATLSIDNHENVTSHDNNRREWDTKTTTMQLIAADELLPSTNLHMEDLQETLGSAYPRNYVSSQKRKIHEAVQDIWAVNTFVNAFPNDMQAFFKEYLRERSARILEPKKQEAETAIHNQELLEKFDQFTEKLLKFLLDTNNLGDVNRNIVKLIDALVEKVKKAPSALILMLLEGFAEYKYDLAKQEGQDAITLDALDAERKQAAFDKNVQAVGSAIGSATNSAFAPLLNVLGMFKK